MSRRRRRKAGPRPATPPPLELGFDELGAIVERTQVAALSAEDHTKLKAAVATFAAVTAELQATRTSLDRLRRLLFGAKTEKTSTIVGPDAAPGGPGTPGSPGIDAGAPEGRAKRPGHGRNGATAYPGAARVTVIHPTLRRGDGCPECLTGKIYPLAEPAARVRITGAAPLSGTVYECARWRCNLCGEVFTAPAPDGVGDDKYDDRATSMVALLKYGGGLPFNRIETLQRALGIPLPAATQWELVRAAMPRLAPAWAELIRQAAQGEVLYNDDTTMKVLALMAALRAAADAAPDARTGVFTSAIVATGAGYRIALFFTGVKHAGENLAVVLAQRAAELPPPIQMCDALAANTAGDFATSLANCTSHARRRFADVVDAFPAEVRHLLETLRAVYHHDALAREREMSADERLRFHQTESGPLMEGLEAWLRQQFAERLVEPNSGLGQAITFMLKHWAKLTLFLRVPGAPLDNNLCERALKKAILHRKNALFYKTLTGARVGDMFMSFIHTAELNGIAAFDYLVALLEHHREVALQPSAWMPWTYQATLAALRARAGPAP